MKLKPMLNTAKFFLHQNGPTIKAVGGVGLMAVSAVWACKSAVKIHEEHALTDLDIEDTNANTELTEEQREELIKQSKKEIRIYTIKKSAGPTIAFVAGAALNLNGFFDMKARCLGYAALAAGFQKTLLSYRAGVADKIGAEAEADIYNGVTKRTKKTVTDANGNKHKEGVPEFTDASKLIPLNNPLGVYISEVYDPNTHQGSRFWDPYRRDLNMIALKHCLQRAYNNLVANGFMTAYTFVTDFLGCDPQAILLEDPMVLMSWGWKYDPEDPDSNVIDGCGLFDVNWLPTAAGKDYLNGYTRGVLLDLNAKPLFKIDDSYENKLSSILEKEPIYDK
jgi:hypothetical protein